MADSDKKGMSTGAVVAIAAGALVVGAVGTAVVYEMVVVPNAIEAAAGKKSTASTTTGK
jgi:NAD+--asparagine ADP-ribosyltransferase